MLLRSLDRARSVTTEVCVSSLARTATDTLSHAPAARSGEELKRWFMHAFPRYEHCDLESYAVDFSGAHPSLRRAYAVVRRFLDEYPLGINGTGLLFTGSIGVGKTHLAVGLLRELILNRSVQGLFYDYRDLLKQVQNSHNPNVAETELSILGPVFNAEVLVLDEIDASKPSEWVWDTLAHILNTRYNDRKVTILTTNYPNLPPAGGRYAESPAGQARAAMREESLGDRIGERMRSRLQEMCLPVE